MNNAPWDEKYGIDGIKVGPVILPTDTTDAKELLDLLEKGIRPRKAILLYSDSGGTAKTTYGQHLINTKRYSVHHIDSTNANTEELRSLSAKLANKFSDWDEDLIIVDEISEAKSAFLDGLKTLIDKSKGCLFIFTDNKGKELAQKYPRTFGGQRVTCYSFDTPNSKSMEKVLKEILKLENISPSHFNIPRLVSKNYPSIRVAINELHREAKAKGLST